MKLNSVNNLRSVRPSLAAEWHPKKNLPITPDRVTPSSARKVWWFCKNGHEWIARIDNRLNGKGCPYCANQRVDDSNSLASKNPKLASEWHPRKNGLLSPMQITASSGKKVWWLCSKGHEWFANAHGRSSGRGCPYCSNKAVNNENSLQSVKPELVKEWDFEKNKDLNPSAVTCGSQRKVWWICKKKHEWYAPVSSRVRKNMVVGCPFCKSSTSAIELRVFSELKTIFNNIEHRKKRVNAILS